MPGPPPTISAGYAPSEIVVIDNDNNNNPCSGFGSAPLCLLPRLDAINAAVLAVWALRKGCHQQQVRSNYREMFIHVSGPDD